MVTFSNQINPHCIRHKAKYSLPINAWLSSISHPKTVVYMFEGLSISDIAYIICLQVGLGVETNNILRKIINKGKRNIYWLAFITRSLLLCVNIYIYMAFLPVGILLLLFIMCYHAYSLLFSFYPQKASATSLRYRLYGKSKGNSN